SGESRLPGVFFDLRAVERIAPEVLAVVDPQCVGAAVVRRINETHSQGRKNRAAVGRAAEVPPDDLSGAPVDPCGEVRADRLALVDAPEVKRGMITYPADAGCPCVSPLLDVRCL